MMRRISMLLLFGVAFSTCFGADVQSEVENELRESLRRVGVCEGTGRSGDSMVVVSSVAMKMSGGDLRGFVMRRQRSFRLAEIRARAKILSFLSVKMSGGTSVIRGSVNGFRTKTISTTVGLFANRELYGVELEAFSERLSSNEYALAVAYRWSVDLERNERNSMAGILRASEAWQREMDAWLPKRYPGDWPPTMIFQDSAGFVHHIGVGYACLPGRLPHEIAVAVSAAESASKKNLQLSMFGAQEMKKQAELLGQWEGNQSCTTTSLYDFFVDMKTSGALVPFFNVGEGTVKCAVTGLDVYKVAVAEAGSNVQRGASRGVDLTKTNAQNDRPMMIFNPVTQKYEEVK